MVTWPRRPHRIRTLNQMTPELEETTLEHAKAAYANAQETIRFIDTKAGALTGLLTLAVGLPIWVIQWLGEQKTEESSLYLGLAKCEPYILVIGFLAWSCGIMAGVVSLWLVLDCIAARPPSRKRKPTILFPMVADRHSAYVIARRLTVGLSTADTIGEYRTQCLRVGAILAKKVIKFKRAMRWFKAQIASYSVGIIAIIFLYLTNLN